jgi:hypothetical protein
MINVDSSMLGANTFAVTALLLAVGVVIVVAMTTRPTKTCESQVCAQCGATGAKKSCGQCRAVRYCSASCQKLHWKRGGHKQACGAHVSATAAGAQLAAVDSLALCTLTERRLCPICHTKDDTFDSNSAEGVPPGIGAFCGELWCSDCNTNEARVAQNGCPQCGVKDVHVPDKIQWAAVNRLVTTSMGRERFLSRAQLMIGNYYDNGRAVKKNTAAAAVWYRKAADLGDRNAQHNLAQLYLRGDGVPRDRQWNAYSTKAALSTLVPFRSGAGLDHLAKQSRGSVCHRRRGAYGQDAGN